MPVVQVEHLRKTYGSVVAVESVSFEVHRGEIFGMVGPNGAGKTTTIECCEGIRRPDGGRVSILGMNPHADGYPLRERIGVQLQECALPDRLKVWEALTLFSSFYRQPVDWRPLLEKFGLSDKHNAAFTDLSGGQKRRLFIILALINDPELVFFDELTTGLDPQARQAMWALVREIQAQDKTIFLTTHFMEEAERLCDRVAIIDQGRIIALDRPENLIRNLGAESRIVFSVDGPLSDAVLTLPAVSHIEHVGERVTVFGDGESFVGDVVNALAAAGVRFRDLRTEQPTLEDVFLKLTGREVRD